MRSSHFMYYKQKLLFFAQVIVTFHVQLQYTEYQKLTERNMTQSKKLKYGA